MSRSYARPQILTHKMRTRAIHEQNINGDPKSHEVYALSQSEPTTRFFLWACRARRPRRLLQCECLAALALLTLPLPCLRSDDTAAEVPSRRAELSTLLDDRRLQRRPATGPRRLSRRRRLLARRRRRRQRWHCWRQRPQWRFAQPHARRRRSGGKRQLDSGGSEAPAR